MDIGNHQLKLVNERFPELQFKESALKLVVTGEFCFDAAFDEVKREYIINPSAKQIQTLIRIKDCYSTRIVIPKDGLKPTFYEVECKINAEAQNLGIDPIDLHMNSDGSCCPVGALDEIPYDSLIKFLDGPVLQFFYDQSYHAQNGSWPRGQFLHGLLGIPENYFEIGLLHLESIAKHCLHQILCTKTEDSKALRLQEMLKSDERVQGHWKCVCDSMKDMRDCHENFFKGLWNLQKWYKELRRKGVRI